MSGPPPTRRGYDAWEAVSALQKAIRRSKVKEAVYWAMELYASGHKAWVWNRVQVICAEDIGPADRYLPAQIATLRQWSERAKEGGGMELVYAVILLATSRKSRITSWMVMEAVSDYHERIEIPDEALDQHTRRGRQMGRGAKHFVEHGQTMVQPEDAGDLVDLERLEAESMQHWLKVMTGDTDDLPHNPLTKKDESLGREPGQNSDTVTSGQLRMTGETEEER